LCLSVICLVAVGVFYFSNGWGNEQVQASLNFSEQSLVIFNPNSHPQAGDNWTVSFETKGTADLTITPDNQESIDDLDFVSLKCGDEERNPQILSGGVIFYHYWHCNGQTASETHLVNVAGHHTLKFQFSDQIKYAYNSPSTEVLRPNGAGTETSIEGSSEATHWEAVDEDTADDSSTYIYTGTTTAFERDLYALPAHTGSGTINNVEVYFRISGGYWPQPPTCNGAIAKAAIRTYSTNYEGAEKTQDCAWATFSETWTINPYTNATWTWSEIDGLEAGLLLKADGAGPADVLCTQVYVEVDYTPPGDAPTVTTSAATSITTSTAALNGNITDVGAENCDERGFDWGTTPGNYSDSWTETGSFATGTFSHQITGLSPNTTYYFRAKAHNSVGWGQGSELSFTTNAATPAVTNNGGACDVDYDSARLRGEVTDAGGEDPTVHIYWGDNDGGTATSSWDHDENLGTKGTGSFEKTIESLTHDTTYYYRCRAVNSGGEGWATSTTSFTTEKLPVGYSCSSDSDCASGNCQFDVCCKSSCTGNCHCHIFYSTTSDGYAYRGDASYANAHGDTGSSTYSTCYSSYDFLYIANSWTGDYYYVRRSFLYFDTSSLGTGTEVSTSTLTLYGSAKQQDDSGHANLYIVEGIQADPFTIDDFDAERNKTTSGGSIDYTSFNDTYYNDIDLNSTGISWISVTGTTKFCLRVSGDINNSTPTGYNNCKAYSNEKGTDDYKDYRPKLYVEYSTNQAPTVDSVSLNGGNAIILNEATTKSVSATGTVSDTDTYSDISSVQGKLYRSGVGSGCATDNSNCYEDTSCATSSCSGNTCDYSCDYNVQFYAEPTDSGTYSGQNWVAWVKVTDSQSASSTATSTGVELNTLQSLDVSASISYGSVSADANSTGDHTATVTDTGNVAIDVQISGTAMSCDIRGSVPVGNQEYATSTFSYGAGTDLSDTATDWNLDLPKPDSGNPTVTDTTYWQVGVPAGTEGTCSGTNTFEARSAL